ncbi:response regulator transcription factor [Brevibacillus fulvus]|uniref:DNA-binding response OmpR family regulator n=1 Tax=Brevibacillus fulvus TaxID=1125967 RepID=A0A938Y6E7_9BACL|nr:response regulator transcription factor [Brevibacillus fulvus]MBM7592090.1 DNA-binding response OmpR family regulator [Brevibacillus fulvus]
MSTTESKGFLLLIEDERNLARYLQLELSNEGYDLDVAWDGPTGLQYALEKHYDLILLDVMIPGLSGLEVCRRIREVDEVPIIMLSARGEIPDKVAGLDSGANDYLTKPFAIEELFARIRVHLRKNTAEESDLIQVGSLSIQPKARRVFRKDEEIILTPREFDLLLHLVEHEGQALSREQLLTEVWGFDFTGNTNVVDVYIRYLRNKLEDDNHPKLIHTVRGIGYTVRNE